MPALLLAVAFQFAAGAPELPVAPSQAVDQVVVVMVVDPSSGAPGEELHTITRHGDRIRDEFIRNGVRTAIFSNVRTGVSVAIGRGNDGRPMHMSVDRRPSNMARYQAEQTQQHDSVLGEACIVWRRAGGNLPVTMHCLTDDGVELWSRVLYSSGDVMTSSRIVSIERRRVRESDVRPPAELLRWRTWTTLYPARTGGLPNDEVSLSSDPDGGVSLTLRRWGDAFYYDRRSPTQRLLNISDGALRVTFSANVNGPERMSIRAVRPDDVALFGSPTRQNQEAVVLGEHCRWFDTMPGVADAGRFECRTDDGATMIMREIGWGGRQMLLTGRQYRRGVVTAASVRPPSEIFDWED